MHLDAWKESMVRDHSAASCLHHTQAESAGAESPRGARAEAKEEMQLATSGTYVQVEAKKDKNKKE